MRMQLMVWRGVQVYLRSHATLRSDMAAWRLALLQALEHDAHARRRFLELAGSPDCPPHAFGEDTEEGLEFCSLYLLKTDQVGLAHCH